MMAHPFLPMTNELLKKLTRAIKDSDQTIKSLELTSVSASQELNSILELNPQCSKNNLSNLRTNNRY